MRQDDLLKPISSDFPCGEDLLAVDDPDFIDYYFNVEDRLPTSYYNVVRGTLFDPKSLDHKAETAQIDGLLKRSKDLRLLGLEAKFQILSGRFKGFADVVLSMAALLEAFPETLHPTDSVDRGNAVEELAALPTIVAPLEYAGLFTDRRAGDVNYRSYGTGAGKINPRDTEDPGDSGAILNAIGSIDNAKAVDELYALLGSLRAALKRIAAACQAAPDPCSPHLERLDDKLAEIMAMVEAGRPDLGAGNSIGNADTAELGGEAGSAADTAGNAAGVAQAAAPVSGVANHRVAYRLLQAVETYFATVEPASLALVLVTQSRLLIGRPLVEAIDALLENNAAYAKLNFDQETGFSLSMSRMRELSGYAGITSSDEWLQGGEDDPPTPDVVSRDQAGNVLKAVEEFFRLREPASPIPILLFKARNMLSKDFQALVRELIPNQE